MPRRGRKHIVLFTRDDWKNAGTLERIYMHLVQPDDFELTYEQEEKLEKLRMVWGIMSKTLNTMNRVKLIMQELDVSRRGVFRLMDDAQYLFGEILRTTAQEELATLKEKYYALADLAEKDGDFDTARRALDSAAELIVKLDEFEPKQAPKLPEIIFTNNPKALQSRTDDAEDAEFETIPGLLEHEAVAIPAGPAAD